MVAYATRPPELSGCWSQWSEQDVATVIRSTMDDGSPKVRRRFTGVSRQADAAVTLKKSLVASFMSWFRTTCQQGVMPTNIVEPDGTKSVWRFTAPPTVTWNLDGTAQVQVTMERLPGWQVL